MRTLSAKATATTPPLLPPFSALESCPLSEGKGQAGGDRNCGKTRLKNSNNEGDRRVMTTERDNN